MIQAEPLYLVVTGVRESRRVHFASKFQNQAHAFATAFAHDPGCPHIEEYQMITLGGDFNVGAKAFDVRMPREGKALEVDDKPGMSNFGYLNWFTNDPPDVVFHVWARNGVEAEARAIEMRDRKLRNGEWPPMNTRWPIRTLADLPKKPRSDFDVAIYGPRSPFLSLALSAHYGVGVDGFMAKPDTPGVRAMEDVLEGLRSDGLVLFGQGPGHVIPIVTVSTFGPPPTPPTPTAFGIAFWIEEVASR